MNEVGQARTGVSPPVAEATAPSSEGAEVSKAARGYASSVAAAMAFDETVSEVGRRGELGSLALEARVLTQAIYVNWLRLGGVLIRAKELVPRGEWGQWLGENAPVGERTAQNMMAAWRRFGDKPLFEPLGGGKLTALLQLPSGSEEQFAEENDLESMSARAVQEAVKAAVEEARQKLEADRRQAGEATEKAQAEAARERERAELAERRVNALEQQEPQIPEEVSSALSENEAALKQRDEEIARLSEIARKALDDKIAAERSEQAARRDKQEAEDMLIEKQRDCDTLQASFLDLQSSVAKGDVGRPTGEELTLDEFASAVQRFIGSTARMPYMGGVFAAMHQAEKYEYETLLNTVEGWARGARAAMNTVEGGMIDV